MSVYTPPAAGGGQEGCSGSCSTSSELRYQYVASYFNAHAFAIPSYRYQFITWLGLAVVIIFIAAFHHSGIADQTWIGAQWHRWAVKKRVIKVGRNASIAENDSKQKREQLLREGKKPSRKVYTFPSFGRTMLLAALLVIPIVLTIVGADFIRPTAGVFDMGESWPSTNISIFTPGLSKRLEWGQGQYPPVSIQAPTITLPYRTWWTAGSRAGAMVNALTPLIVVIALKQIPFSLLSTRLLGGFSFDRLSFMHKWGGRVVWLFATAHVILWSIQLSKDRAFEQPMWNFVFVWTKFRWGFVSYGFFTLLILLSVGPMRTYHYEVFYVCHVVCIIGFMVAAWLHHPPAGQWMYVTLLWWAAERITRAFKVAWVNGIGFAGRKPKQALQTHGKASGRNLSVSISEASSHTMHSPFAPHSALYQKQHLLPSRSGPPPPPPPPGFSKAEFYDADSYHQGIPADNSLPIGRRKTRHSQRYDPVGEVISDYAGQQPAIRLQDMNSDGTRLPYQTDEMQFHRKGDSKSSSPPETNSDHGGNGMGNLARMRGMSSKPSGISSSSSSITWGSAGLGPRPAMAADIAAVLRPGFAYAQLLPGKTLRLTLRTPNPFTWSAGQYIQLCIPSVHFWESHPFTIASAYNAGFPSSTVYQEDDAEKGLIADANSTKEEERTIVLLIRARRGFTNALWNYVCAEREKQIRAIEQQTGHQYARGEVSKRAAGVHLRAIIDGPYGSIQRVRWGIHSTVLIICGGSGISSGMSILEYLCSSMAIHKQVKGFQVRRVRFVWMMREYSHLQWVASAMRRCIEMVPPELLQVDLYVTKIQRRQRQNPGEPNPSSYSLASTSTRAKGNASRPSSGYADSSFGFPSNDESYHNARFTEGDDQLEYEIDAMDLTGFAGEDNSGPSAAEAKISAQVAKEGKLRRANTRKASIKRMERRKGGPQTAASPAKGLPLSDQSGPSLMHQRSVHESNRRQGKPSQSNSVAEPLPENDLGTEYIYQEDHREPYHSVATAYRGTDGVLGPQKQRAHDDGLPPWQSGHNHSQTSLLDPLSGVHYQPTGSLSPSPQPSPALTPSHLPCGQRTLGEESWVDQSHHPGSLTSHNYSSTAHLTGPRSPGMWPGVTPHPIQQEQRYTSGEDLQPVPSDADIPIDLDEEEFADLQVLAELARTGYPKLDVILREEAQQSAGRVLVSACGPETLGHLIRSIASKQINVSEIRKGHLNAHINVISESFEWGG